MNLLYILICHRYVKDDRLKTKQKKRSQLNFELKIIDRNNL